MIRDAHPRDELAADIETARTFTATDWLREGVDTVLAPGVVARSTVHACVYAIYHGERGAESTFSVARPPMKHEAWRDRDAVTASLLSVWLLAALVMAPTTLPSGVAGAIVAAQCVPLALDPVLTLAEVAG